MAAEILSLPGTAKTPCLIPSCDKSLLILVLAINCIKIFIRDFKDQIKDLEDWNGSCPLLMSFPGPLTS